MGGKEEGPGGDFVFFSLRLRCAFSVTKNNGFFADTVSSPLARDTRATTSRRSA